MRDGEAFLYIDSLHSQPDQAADILLADFSNCAHTPVQTTSEDLRAWKSREGIGLGSPETEVLKAYGVPSAKQKLVPGDDNTMKFFVFGYRHGDKWVDIGEKSISYRGSSDDLRTAIFCIRDGKVSCIFLSKNE
jgi:hypothetical protein